MASFNKVILMGNLARDPEVRYTASGSAVCNCALAVNNSFVTAAGETREDVCFVDFEVWGKQAESLQRFKRKGEAVMVEGRLRQDKWQDSQTGQARSRILVRAERVVFVGARQAGAEGGYQQAPQQAQQNYGGYQQNAAPANSGFQMPPQPATPPPAAPNFSNAPVAPSVPPQNIAVPPAPKFEAVAEPEDDIPF